MPSSAVSEVTRRDEPVFSFTPNCSEPLSLLTVTAPVPKALFRLVWRFVAICSARGFSPLSSNVPTLIFLVTPLSVTSTVLSER